MLDKCDWYQVSFILGIVASICTSLGLITIIILSCIFPGWFIDGMGWIELIVFIIITPCSITGTVFSGKWLKNNKIEEE